MQDSSVDKGTAADKRWFGRLTTRQVVMAFIAVQVIVPSLLLGFRWVQEGSRPTTEFPLSWQMYSAVKMGDYIGVDKAGDEVKLLTDGLPAFERSEGYSDDVARALCSTNPDVVSISRKNANPYLSEESVSC